MLGLDGPFLQPRVGVQPRETLLSGERVPTVSQVGSAVLPSCPRHQDFGKHVFFFPVDLILGVLCGRVSQRWAED